MLTRFTGRAAWAVWAALIVPPFATIAAPPAAAQIIAGPGQSVTVPAGDTITCTNCVALFAPGGTIMAPTGPFTLNVDSTGIFTAGAFIPANTGGVIQLNNGTINNTTTAGGQGAQGVISQTGGLITGTNVNINGSGFASTALAAEGGQIIWNGGVITMTGNTASGVITAWSGGTVTVNGTTFPNPVSQGVELGGGGTVTLNGVDMTTTSFGVFAHQAFSPAPNTFTMNGGSLTAVLPFDAGLATGTPSLATFNVNDAVVTATGGRFPLFDVVSGSTATLNASGSTLTGSAFTDSTSTSTVNLTNGSVWTITGCSTCAIPDNSNVTTLTNNNSTINFLAPTGDPTLQSSYLTLTTVNYVGVGGRLGLNTFLGTDGSPSNQLIINSGSGSGSTNILVRNTGGPGAETVSNGILVVQAINGATTTANAFSLAGGRVTAGAFDYVLFRGGVSPGSQDSWFLRSSLVAPPTPETPTPTPAPGSPPLPTPVPGAPPIPLFDPEVPLKSVVPSVARTLGLVTLGTFNERQGDQLLLRGDDLRVGGWGRVFGQQTREHFAQGAQPDFDGTFAGFQAGADLLRWESSNGHRDHIGFYVAEARASGSVHGLVDAFEGALAGHVDLDAMSYAGYWTHLGPSNWYIDAVVQWTHIHGSPLSIRGVSNDIRGRELTGSIEAGYPIALTPWLTFEPQIQGIWQRVSFDDTQDPFSTITFDRSNVFTGRAGALLRGSFGSTGALWQPYLKGNVWWGSNGFDTVRFDADPIQTGRNGGITLEGGGGVTGKLTRNVSIYGDASYLSSVSGESRITLKGNVGLRVTW
jgi:outer membrane autotransporter protein